MKDITELERELQEYKKRKQKKSDEQTIEVLSEDATPQVVDVSNMEEVYDGNDYQVYWDQASGKYYCSEHGFVSNIEDHMDAEHNDDVEDFEIEYFSQKLSKQFAKTGEYVPKDQIEKMAKEQSHKRLMEKELEAQKLSIRKIDQKILTSLEESLKGIESFLISKQTHCPLCNLQLDTAISSVDPEKLSRFVKELSDGNPELKVKSVRDLSNKTFSGKIGGHDAQISTLALLHICDAHLSLAKYWSETRAIESKALSYFLDEPIKLSKDEGYKIPSKTFSISDENSNLLSWLRKKNQDTQKASRD